MCSPTGPTGSYRSYRLLQVEQVLQAPSNPTGADVRATPVGGADVHPTPVVGGADVHPTPVALCATQWYEVFKQRMGATRVRPLEPTLVWGRQGDCNESPIPQRDPKVMGRVRLTTCSTNLVYRSGGAIWYMRIQARQPGIEAVSAAPLVRRRVD